MAASPYSRPLKAYCDTYGVSYRTILRYSKAGFPLDDEAQTRLLISTGTKPIANPISQASPNFTQQFTANAPQTACNAQLGALGLPANIQRLREAEAVAHSDYQSADQETKDARQKQWLAISEQLRKVEQSTPEIEESNKNTIRLEEIEAALGEVFLKLRQDLESLPKRAALEASGKDEIAIRGILKRETDEIITALYSCKYLGGGASE